MDRQPDGQPEDQHGVVRSCAMGCPEIAVGQARGEVQRHPRGHTARDASVETKKSISLKIVKITMAVLYHRRVSLSSATTPSRNARRCFGTDRVHARGRYP